MNGMELHDMACGRCGEKNLDLNLALVRSAIAGEAWLPGEAGGEIILGNVLLTQGANGPEEQLRILSIHCSGCGTDFPWLDAHEGESPEARARRSMADNENKEERQAARSP